jgi:hypothetical protein
MTDDHDPAHRHYVVEASKRRVVLTARHAGQARTKGLRLLGLSDDERDQVVVGEPEDEEVAEFESRA